MLLELRIKNLVLAREVRLEFSPGLNLITGETGAGKSLIAGALSLVAGARADSSVVRQGEERAVIEARFSLTEREDVLEALARAGYETEGGELLVRREISSDGRSRAFLGDGSATVGALRSHIGELLELHGQQEPQSLLSPGTHRELLDRFGAHVDELAEVRRTAIELREQMALIRELEERADAREGRLEMLRFRLAEFEQVHPADGEEEKLRAQRERLRHAEAIGEAVRGAVDGLYEAECCAIDQVHAAARRLEAQASHNADLGDYAERLTGIREELAEIAGELRDGAADLAPDPGRLAEIEDRLHAIERLRRRFEGASLADVVESAGRIRREIEELTEQSESQDTLRASAKATLERYRDAAARLREARRRAAGSLAERVGSSLAALAMGKARLDVSLSGPEAPEIDAASAAPDGADQVEFLLGANPGEPPRPLRRVASGGELSRLMLALAIALEGGLRRRLLLFDEVDQGLGGDAADRLGDFLSRLARQHQVICVTHLPQVAARGQTHVTVTKRVRSGRTFAVVKSLEDTDDRVEELARMLGGRRAGDAAYRHAEELMRATCGAEGDS